MTEMQKRELGRSGLEVSAIGLGCFGMSGVYGPVSDAESIAAIRMALDQGINLVDTADIYGRGHTEEIIGRAIRGRRDEVVISTKCGIAIRWSDGESQGFDGSAEYVRHACEQSLLRLGVDTIDLYQLHRVDPATPIEETVGAFAELVGEGKVRYVGLSEALAPDIVRAASVHPIASLQSEYSLLERGLEDEILDVCEELGIGLLAFAPLSRGLLGGSLVPSTELDGDDLRRGQVFDRVGPRHLADNAVLAEVVDEIAAEHGATPAQVSLAWLLGRRPWIVPIPGTKRASHAADNAGAAGLTLTTHDNERLEALADKVRGDRFGEWALTPDWLSPPAR